MTQDAERVRERWCEARQRFYNPREWKLHLQLCKEHPTEQQLIRGREHD